jgi:hypothetical protein
MAFVSTNSVNLTTTSATQAGDWLWAIKTALKAAGWTVQGSGDGTSFQNGGSTDYITSQTVASNNNAWIRLREPSGVGGREYLFAKGSASDRLLVKYSRSSGFTTVPGSASAIPTTGLTGDGVVFLGTSTGFSATGTGTNTYDQAATVTPASPTLAVIQPGYVSCVASDTPVNGVYGWWAFQNTLGNGFPQYMMFTEGMDSTTCSPLDYDPSIRQWSRASAQGFGDDQRAYNANTVNLVQYWEGYPAVWSSPTAATYRLSGCGMISNMVFNTAGGAISWVWPQPAASATPALSPYNGKSGLLPVLIYKAGAVAAGNLPKGFTSGLRFTYGPFNNCDTLDLTTSTPNITLYASTMSGAATAWIVQPWVQNVIAKY